jgi:hypothetical protein
MTDNGRALSDVGGGKILAKPPLNDMGERGFLPACRQAGSWGLAASQIVRRYMMYMFSFNSAPSGIAFKEPNVIFSVWRTAEGRVNAVRQSIHFLACSQ